MTRVLWLNKGDKLQYYVYSDQNLASITDSIRPMDFEFALIGGQGTDPIAFQAMQDEVADLKETIQELKDAIES